MDIAPTLLELAGVGIPSAMQGHSMVPLLQGQTPPHWRKAQFYTYWGAPSHHGIRTDRYTYLKIDNHPVELFDRRLDPEQLHNIARDPKNGALIVTLEAELQRQIQAAGISAEALPGGKKKW